MMYSKVQKCKGEIVMLTASDYRERARASLKGKWGMAVLVCFLGILLGGISVGSPVSINYDYNKGVNFDVFGIKMDPGYLSAGVLGLLSMVIGVMGIYALAKFLIGGAVELGICAYFSKQALGEQAGIEEEFAYFKYFGKALGLRVVTSVFIFLWSLLLVVPGIIAAYRYSMATYLMAEHPEMGIMEAIEASKQMMDGNKWSLFCLEISFIGWAILAALTFGIGELFLNPYIQMATAHFYLNLSRGGNNNAGMNNNMDGNMGNM